MMSSRPMAIRWASGTTLVLVYVITLPTAALGQVNLPEGFEVVEFGAHDYPMRPRMNNCGEVVFWYDVNEASRIYLYDNGRITAVTGPDGDYFNLLPDINDQGTVAWVRGIYNDLKSTHIVVLQRGERIILGLGGPPAINLRGDIATQFFRRERCGGELDYDTILYTDEQMLRLDRDRLWDQSHSINDQKDVVWNHTNFCVDPWAGDILMYSQGDVRALPSEHTQVQGPDVNNHGDAVWDAGPVVELY